MNASNSCITRPLTHDTTTTTLFKLVAGCQGKKIPKKTWERVGKEESATRPAKLNDRDQFDTTILFADLERLKILGIGEELCEAV